MSEATDLQFIADPAAWKPPAGMVVRIPAGIRSKQKLLAIIGDGLDFPAWNGLNWDAFEEALCDLSWLRPGCVTLVHDDLPFGRGENCGIYLSILAQSCRFWRDNPARSLAAVFPASAAEAVTSALASADEQQQ